MAERPSFQPISNSGHSNDMQYYGVFFLEAWCYLLYSIICQFHQHWILIVASNSSFRLLMHHQVNAQLTLNASAFSVPINSHADAILVYLGFDPLYFLAISRRSSNLALIPKWSVWVVRSIFSSGCKLSKWDKYHHIAKTTRQNITGNQQKQLWDLHKLLGGGWLQSTAISGFCYKCGTRNSDKWNSGSKTYHTTIHYQNSACEGKHPMNI